MSKTPSQQTPSEIDTQLAHLSEKLAKAERYAKGYRKSLASNPTGFQSATWNEQLGNLEDEIHWLKADIAPLHQEYTNRRWNRAFIAQSADGHIHSSMYCSTCNKLGQPTDFGWLPELSGKTEAEIIEFAGLQACTVCYPNAPVTPQMRKAAKATEVAARKAEREEIKRQKMLTKVPRQHAEAIKVNELFDAFGENVFGDGSAYEATYPGKRFGKGYDNAFHVYSDIIESQRRRAR